MATVTGDFEGLHALIEGFRRTATDFIPAASEAWGADALELTHDSYAQQAGPWGTPWQPSKRALRDGGLTLVDTGALLAGWKMYFGPAGFGVRNDVIYARIHQYGWPRAAYHPPPPLPPRPQIPEENENLGSWGPRFGRTGNRTLEATLGPRALASADDTTDLHESRVP